MKFNKWTIGLAAVAISISGCASKAPAPTSTPVAVVAPAQVISPLTPLEIGLAQIAVEDSATALTAQELQSHPSEKPDFLAAVVLLQELAGGTNQITAATVQAIAKSAGETNQVIVGLIGNLTTQAPALINAAGTDPTAQSAALKTILGWDATGINNGIPQ